jgi:hypothetical protein
LNDYREFPDIVEVDGLFRASNYIGPSAFLFDIKKLLNDFLRQNNFEPGVEFRRWPVQTTTIMGQEINCPTLIPANSLIVFESKKSLTRSGIKKISFVNRSRNLTTQLE